MGTMQEKYIIKYLYEQKNPVRKISRKLKIPYTTVQNFIKNRLNKGHINRKNESGRKCKFTRLNKQKLFETKELNILLSPAKLARKMKEIFDLSVTERTTMNYLKSDGFYAVKLVSKPRLSQVQKNKRLEICTGWSFQNNEYFNNVIFLDETKFNLKNSDD
ncbi:Transposable element Tc3 transposase [Cucumispora dikerogammari]|nr:Transposable element Tc3 transposase [Cucumispora dikerogammari]